MIGVLCLFVFLLCGEWIARGLFVRQGLQVRLWLGACIGFVLMMWLPSLNAFAMRFTREATLLAMGEAAALAGLIALFPKDKRAIKRRPPEPGAGFVLACVLPLLILSAYLQYTHTLREVDGAYFVGQSTYGDLSLHLGIATGLRNAAYPPEYTLLPGTMLGYPFLFDALSASMLLLGSSLQTAFLVPGILAMGLVYWGFLLLAWEMTRDRLASALAYVLAFLNGGLGFLYLFDGFPQDTSRLADALFEYYRAPANLVDYNVRWSNLICDLLIPQRTLLAGFLMLLPAFWLLIRAIRTKKRATFVLLGLWAGCMPMVHTHSFLALGMVSFGALIDCLLRDRQAWKTTLIHFGLYGAIAVLLALPQLMTWTFPQTVGSGALSFRFNWVNTEIGALKDGYLWFWLKNVGPAYLLLLPAALNAPKRLRPVCLGALIVYLVAELIQFQPNEYDNNKLFYAAFLLMMPTVGALLAHIWRRLQGVRGRAILACAFLVVCTLSACISLAREAISSYMLFSASEVEAARYIEENAPEDALFLTGTQHCNAVAALTGRKIVCGTGSYLYFHGVDYAVQEADAKRMLAQPETCAYLFSEHGVDFAYISTWETFDAGADSQKFQSLYPLWFENDSVQIYAISERAQQIR